MLVSDRPPHQQSRCQVSVIKYVVLTGFVIKWAEQSTGAELLVYSAASFFPSSTVSTFVPATRIGSSRFSMADGE